MAHIPHAFENQIFQHFRDNANKINNCIEFLTQHNYTVIDLEGDIITKDNLKKQDKFDLDFKESSNYRIPKLKKNNETNR